MPEDGHLGGLGVEHPGDGGRDQLLGRDWEEGHLPEKVGRLLGVVGMGPGEIDQGVDGVLGDRPATGPKARHQEAGEFLPRQRAEGVGARHLQEWRVALVHRSAEQGLARSEQRVRHMLLVLDHGTQLPQQRRTKLHQVLELVEDDHHPLFLARARDHLRLPEDLLQQGIEAGKPGAARLAR